MKISSRLARRWRDCVMSWKKTTASNASNERGLREMRRKNEAYRAAVHTARGNDSAARAMMRDSVLTLNRMEDAAHARDVQILKEKHAAKSRMHGSSPSPSRMPS